MKNNDDNFPNVRLEKNSFIGGSMTQGCRLTRHTRFKFNYEVKESFWKVLEFVGLCDDTHQGIQLQVGSSRRKRLGGGLA